LQPHEGVSAVVQISLFQDLHFCHNSTEGLQLLGLLPCEPARA